jgi:serine phosphatase RsbU (regulator of sigma subunit)/CheY-like chemotaxis protein
MSSLSRIQVLVLDDHEEMAQLIALMLRRDSIDVIIANDGLSGFELFKQTHPDVVITDLMMPNMDGFGFMERALKHNPLIPIIVVTAYGSMNSAIRALRLGAFDFITKPFDKKEVRATVAKAARQQIAQKYDVWRQKITEALNIPRDPAEIVQKLIGLTVEALEVEYGLILGSDGQSILWAYPNEDVAFNKPFVALSNQAGLTDFQAEQPTSHQLKPSSRPSQADLPASVVGVQFVAHKMVKGIFILAHAEEAYFNQEDLNFLEQIAPVAALALDNAQTYAKLQASNNRLASLQRISTLTYNANIPINRMLRLVAEGIRQNLYYSGVILCLPEAGSGDLVIRTAAGDLDRFLQRRGDTPTRRIAISLEDVDNPICRAFKTRTVQETPVEDWISVLEKAGASDMAVALSELKLSRLIFLPLWQAEEVIGILGVGHLSPRPLSNDETNLLTSLANQTALIIKNSTLYQMEQQGRREMEALYQAGLVITSSLSQEDVLKTILEQIVDLTLFESCIIGRWDERREAEVIELYMQKTAQGWIEIEPPGTVYPLSKRPLVAEALTQRKMRVIRLNDDGLSPAEQAWMTQTEAKLRLIIPLIVRSNSIGVLELITTKSNLNVTPHVSRITQGLAAQAAIALENARLHESEIKRIEHELDLAHRIQVSLLPHETPQIPGMTIAARTASARMVGGDFYRYLSLPNGHFGVVVGDVSGKGVPSALYMAMTITAMDTQIRQQGAPGEMLQQLNAVLYPRMHANRMNTALLVTIFNSSKSRLQVANAGMIAPLIRQQQAFDWLDVSGLPLGATMQTSYKSSSIALATHSTIILASDGLIEAQNQAKELFGFDRFQASAQRLTDVTSSQQILDNIWNDVTEHIGDAEQNDDMTLVVIQTWGRQGDTKELPKLPEAA